MATLNAYYQFNIDAFKLKTYIKNFESDYLERNVNNPWEDNYTIFADSIDAAIELLGSDFGRNGAGDMVRGNVEGLSEWFWDVSILEWVEIYNLTDAKKVTSQEFFDAFQTNRTDDDLALWETMLSRNDRFNLSDDNDTANGFAGKDKMFGFAGNDVLRGDDGRDKLYGGANNDKLLGGNDADQLSGGDDNDTLKGGDGNDVIRGGAGRDKEFGGAGEDIFKFKTGDDLAIIRDFDAKGLEHDVLNLKGLDSIRNWNDLNNNHMVKDGRDVVIDGGDGDVIILKNVSLSALDKGDFVF